MSGVDVATMIRSTSAGRRPADCRRGARRRQRQIAADFAFRGKVARADAGALDDPRVGRLDAALGQLGPGRHWTRAGRQVAAGTGDAV
jgi:hypothetical protein